MHCRLYIRTVAIHNRMLADLIYIWCSHQFTCVTRVCIYLCTSAITQYKHYMEQRERVYRQFMQRTKRSMSPVKYRIPKIGLKQW